MRYCFVPFGMIKTRKIDNNKYKEVEELKLSYTERINMKWYNHFGKTVRQFLEVLHMPTTQFSHPTPIYLPKGKESMCLYKGFIHVHNSFICNMSKLQTIQMSF